MNGNKEVIITIKVDGVEKEIKSVDELKQAVKQLGDTTKKTEKETGFFEEKVQELKDGFKGLIDGAKGLKTDFTNWTNSLKTTQGVLGKLRVALSALGLPLLITAITTAYEYFTNFEGGVKLVSTAMNVLNAVVGKVTDSVVKLFSGDFKGFIDSFLGIADAAGDAVDNTNKQFEAQAKLAELTKKNTVENAKLTQQLEFATKVLEDETATYEQRVQALKDVEAAELKLIENKKLETELILQNLKAQLSLEKNYEKRRELAQQIADAEAEVINKQTELATKSGEANKKIREINIQRAKEAEEAAKKQAEINQQFIDQQVKYAQEATLAEITDDRERARQQLEFDKQNEETALQRSAFNAEQRAALLLQIQEKYKLKEGDLNEKFRKEDEDKQKASDDKKNANALTILEILNKKKSDSAVLQAENELEAEYEKNRKILIDAEATTDQLALLDKQLEDDKAANRQKAIEDVLANAENQGLDPFETAQKEIDAEYEKNRQILIDAKATDDQLAALDKAYVEGTKQLAKEEASFKRQQAAGLADGIASLVGETSKVGKIASIASATINTFEGATKAIAQGGFFGIATAAITIAAGLKNIQKIIQTKVPGESGGVTTPSTLSGAASTPTFDPRAALDEAARNSTMVNRVGTMDLGSTPMKAYVVATDMTSEQEKQTKINNLSRL